MKKAPKKDVLRFSTKTNQNNYYFIVHTYCKSELSQAANKVFVSLGTLKTEDAVITLIDREKEFLKYSVTEMSYKEIAEKMFCSPRTVESSRDNLFEN